ncbi:biotin-dependent carboxyltransferase family protein [Brenneria izadpanahii]|uniref:Biotin-dependent carboxyltransferase family protein n=1 Tax=Brenneria izadpanahii TaxID=2722756 RepID=A0ABX7USY2_9GAMM|nr:biotin-dependent carboxyltransferase family protein [Brenneria izadpanahii]QTF08878.1 biotin-dependent carboxyltransferase family protein [Brenneria izadpanahii]
MIEVLKTGPLNTVQDLGRSGFRHLGVSVSGVMDPLALRVGNLLLGNEENAAGVEIQFFPFRARFLADTAIALTGADCRALLDDTPLPSWWAHQVRAGQQLEIRYPPHGARGYLCVAGGIDVPLVMGSRSTALRGGFGGWQGRPLQNGDRLPIGRSEHRPLPAGGMGVEPPEVALAAFFPRTDEGVPLLRAIPAGEYELFAADARRFWSQHWVVSMQSNRTGYRLSGEPLRPSKVVEMRSYGLIPGIVQVPPAGEPIIQLSDANTAGGYPKIAGVIEHDLWRLAQIQPGKPIRLIESDVQEAIAVERAVEVYLAALRRDAPQLAQVACGL